MQLGPLRRLIAAARRRPSALVLVGALALVVPTWAPVPDREPSTSTSETSIANDPAADTEAEARTGLARDGGSGSVAAPRLVASETEIPELGGESDENDRDAGDDAASSSLPPKVGVHTPDLVVRADDGATLSDEVLEHRELDDVAHHAAVTEFSAEGRRGDRRDDLDVIGAGRDLRPLTPKVTAHTRGVWQRLDEGDVVVGHDVARELDLELGEGLTLRRDGSEVEVRVGAFAASGAPPLAEAIVGPKIVEQLGASGPNALFVAAGDDAERTGDRLAEATEGEAELRRPPEPERASSTPASPEAPTGTVELEPFRYTDLGDGTISIAGDWVARNISTVTIPGMGTARCHRVMIPQLTAALEELIERGLYDHLDPAQYGGCQVSRFIDFDPTKPLSMHAWGLAIDFNVADNPLGGTPSMDPDVVEVFERWGFEWGGDWSRPDGMHFELERVVDPG